MMTNLKIWQKYILLLSTIAFTISCSPSRKLAKSYVDESSQWGVLVLFPNHLFKINDRYDRDETKLRGLDEFAKQDSLMSQTVLLNDISDSAVLHLFRNAFTESLKTYNIELYTESDFDRFYSRDSLSWIANIAQIELQEFVMDFEDEDSFFGLRYAQSVPLNAVNLAVWVELNALNDSASENKVYFTDQNLTDYLQGQFSYDVFSGVVNYSYNVDTLKTADIYDFAVFMGSLSAAYTYDQILNSRLPAVVDDQSETLFFRYDPYIKRLFQTKNDRFIELE